MNKSRQKKNLKRRAGTTVRSVGGTSTDAVLLDVFNSMMTDFNRESGTEIFSKYRVSSIRDVRNIVHPNYLHVLSPALVRMHLQAEKFFSRYVAEHDEFTEDEVEKATFQSLYDDNIRISALYNLGFNNTATRTIIQKARKKARMILGNAPSVVEIGDSVRFGRRASIGIPLKQSYIDCKAAYPISCTHRLMPLFEAVLAGDHILQDILDNGTMLPATKYEYSHLLERDAGESWHTLRIDRASIHSAVYDVRESIGLVNVPKKFNKKRPVTPYTTVSVFLSLAVGDYMVERLKLHGLDITKLQSSHRKVVRWISKPGSKYGTADLKAASQSITKSHALALLPYDWYKLIKLFHQPTTTYAVESRSYHSETLLGMGSGITFPLQTLLFYCVVDAIREEVLGKSGFVSCYGDDLIYPIAIHRHVQHVFGKLGWIINEDKTFMSGLFRESCGEDRFAGHYVRPFSIEGRTEYLKGAALAAFIYKLWNGIESFVDPPGRDNPYTRRFTQRSLTTTFHTLRRWLCASCGSFHIVPPNFPEYSGVRSITPHCYEEWYMPVRGPVWHTHLFERDTHRGTLLSVPNPTQYTGWRFSCIEVTSNDRAVPYVYPYYWEWLRQSMQPKPELGPYEREEDNSNLRWKSLRGVYRTIKGKKVPRLAPFVTLKGSGKYVNGKSSVPVW